MTGQSNDDKTKAQSINTEIVEKLKALQAMMENLRELSSQDGGNLYKQPYFYTHCNRRLSLSL